MREASGLVRSGRIFGGLIDDIKRKKPFYISDFLHALHPQCISSFLFLYFACLAPIVAFGGLLGEATENRIATIESLISGLVSSRLHVLITNSIYVYNSIKKFLVILLNQHRYRIDLWSTLWTIFRTAPHLTWIHWTSLRV